MDIPISRSKFCPVKLRIVVDFLCLDVKVHLVPYKPEGGADEASRSYRGSA